MRWLAWLALAALAVRAVPLVSLAVEPARTAGNTAQWSVSLAPAIRTQVESAAAALPAVDSYDVYGHDARLDRALREAGARPARHVGLIEF